VLEKNRRVKVHEIAEIVSQLSLQRKYYTKIWKNILKWVPR